MRLRALFVVFSSLVMLGCGKSSLMPSHPLFSGTRALVVDLSVSDSEGSKGHPITIHASVRNEGTARIYRVQGGGLCQGMKLDIRDAAGQIVVLNDPCAPVPIPLCMAPAPMEPGAGYQLSLPFTGDTYRMLAPGSCERIDVPTGTYTVDTGFWVYWNRTDPPEPLQRRVTFHWTSP